MERAPIDRLVDDHRRDHSGEPETGDEGRRLPMAVWDPAPEALPFRGAAAFACHVRRRLGFVDEDEAVRVEIELSVEPLLSPLQYVGPVLLGGMRRLLDGDPPPIEEPPQRGEADADP